MCQTKCERKATCLYAPNYNGNKCKLAVKHLVCNCCREKTDTLYRTFTNQKVCQTCLLQISLSERA